MERNKPVVSIIMPIYNAEKYVADAIRSVLSQTYSAWELILIDDGSTDRTRKEVQPFAEDPRIKYVYQVNGGIANARNRGIKIARGDYLAMIDADDVWLPHKLSRQMEVLHQKNVALIYSGLQHIDHNNNPLFYSVGSGSGVFHGFSTIFKLIAGTISIPNSSVVVSKTWVERVGSYNEKEKVANGIEDYDLWFRLLAAGAKFYGMKDILGWYRRHSGQITSEDSAQHFLMLHYLGSLIEKFPEKINFLKFLILLRLSLYYRNQSDKREARIKCTQAFYFNPYIKSYWFEKYLINLFNFENYLTFRMLLIRKFRRYKTFVALSGKQIQ